MNAILLASAAFTFAGFMGGQTDPQQYAADLATWRKAQTDDLTRDEGFLSVAGLFWLKEGVNAVGSDPMCQVHLPDGSAPAKLAVLNRTGDQVTLEADAGSVTTFTDAGGSVSDTTTLIVPSGSGDSAVGSKLSHILLLDVSRVKIGSMTFVVIKRGKRIGVRLFDKNCAGYKGFAGQTWYPPDLHCMVRARFVPYNPPRSIEIMNVLGDKTPVPIVGRLEFTLNGKNCHLDAEGAGDGLFINFRDHTSGNTTYPAGRFLDASKPVDGYVTLDFNRATNPPCAWTAYATCPLPPRQNYLPVSIAAGEKTHHPVE